jgi:hypothetical protein
MLPAPGNPSSMPQMHTAHQTLLNNHKYRFTGQWFSMVQKVGQLDVDKVVE